MIKKTLAWIAGMTLAASAWASNPVGNSWDDQNTVLCNDGNQELRFTGTCPSTWEVGGIPVVTPATTGPVILYTDLLSGNQTGWHTDSATKGAVVTVWGMNLGTEDARGSNYVTVDGVDLTADTDYLDTWAETSNPVPYLQSITFQLNSSMSEGATKISVTVDGETSNELDFTIDDGRILFMATDASGSGTGTFADPYDCTDSRNNQQPGDVFYTRGGLFDSNCGGKANFYIASDRTPGTRDARVTYTAYPGETPIFDSNGPSSSDSNFNKSFNIQADYITIAKMTTDAWGAGIFCEADGCRAIGNDLEGSKEHVAGEGIIVGGGDELQWLGNTTWGARSQNRLDHSIYINKCNPQPADAGSVVAYNYSYDNQYDRGPAMVLNLQQTRCESNEYNAENFWFNNWISCEGGVANESRAIGIFDQSWADDPGEPLPGFSNVFNNIAVDCGRSDGQGDHAAFYHNNGRAKFYNNAAIGTKGPAASANGTEGGGLHTSNWINNLFIVESGADCLPGSDPAVTIDNNAYQNCGDSLAADANAITDSPLITADLATGVFSLAGNSPLINAGSNAVTDVVTKDINGRSRDANIDVGPIEYITPPPEGIVFETNFANDGAFAIGQQQGSWTAVKANKPEGFQGALVTGANGSITAIPGASPDGTPAMHFMWDHALGQPVTQLFKHLTGDNTTGYDELYVRYHLKLDDNFRAGNPDGNLYYWKFGRLWQNTRFLEPDSPGGGWTEQRADSGYAVWNFGHGNPQMAYCTDAGITYSAATGVNLDQGSAGGERYSAGFNESLGSTCHEEEGDFERVGGGAWDIDPVTRDLVNSGQTWHTIEWRFKLASSPTANDGVFQMWFDGEEQVPETIGNGGNAPVLPDLLPTEIPTPNMGSGYNMLVVMDNMADWQKSWDEPGVVGGIYIADIVVSTDRIGHSYVAGSVQ